MCTATHTMPDSIRLSGNCQFSFRRILGWWVKNTNQRKLLIYYTKGKTKLQGFHFTPFTFRNFAEIVESYSMKINCTQFSKPGNGNKWDASNNFLNLISEEFWADEWRTPIRRNYSSIYQRWKKLGFHFTPFTFRNFGEIDKFVNLFKAIN